MSDTARQRRPVGAAPAPAPAAPARPRLRAVEGLRPGRMVDRRSGVLALVVLGIALLLQLVLSMQLIQGAYAEDALESQRLQVQREVHAGQEQVNAVASPQHLAQLATDLGMVPASGATTLDLGTGTLLGGVDLPHLAPIDPSLVPNSIMNGERDAREAPPQTLPKPGESGASGAEPHVASEFEIAAPTTR